VPASVAGRTRRWWRPEVTRSSESRWSGRANGLRRLTAELRRPGGRSSMPDVGETGCPCAGRSSRVTTGSDRHRPVYLNRSRDLVRRPHPPVCGWPTSSTSTQGQVQVCAGRNRRPFGRVIRWRRSQGIEDDPALTRVAIALESKHPASGFAHHSDRGRPISAGRLHGLAEGAKPRDRPEWQSAPMGELWMGIVDEEPEIPLGHRQP